MPVGYCAIKPDIHNQSTRSISQIYHFFLIPEKKLSKYATLLKLFDIFVLLANINITNYSFYGRE